MSYGSGTENEIDDIHRNLNGTTATATTAASSTTPSASTKTPTQISEFDAIQHIIKGNLGPGCLNIPHAFAMCGWVLGLFLFALVAIQGIYSMVLLVYCKQWLCKDQNRKRRALQNSTNSNGEITEITAQVEKEIVTYMDVAHATHGNAGSISVMILLFVMQAGVCCVFLSLISTNLHAAVPHWDSEWCVFVITVLLLVVVLVRDLKELTWLSVGANILMFTAVLTASLTALWIMFGKHSNDNNEDQIDDDENDDEPSNGIKWTGNPAIIASVVSAFFYSFEGIGLVMPVGNSFIGYQHKNEGNSNGNLNSTSIVAYPGADEFEDDEAEETRIAVRTESFVNPVLLGGMGTVACLFLLIGATCGPAFPDIVDGSVTAYLTTKFPASRWYQLVNAGVMVAVFLTFPLQLTPAMEVLREWFGPGCDPVCCGSNSNTGDGSGSGCCFGGGGLRARGTSTGGRHTRVAQRDNHENQNHAGEEHENFRDENETENNEATAAAAGGVDTRHNSDGNGTGPPIRNSCFGTYEWIFRRYLVVFGCAVVVLTVNDLGLLMSLFGALGNTGLAAMPCIIHWSLMQRGIAPQNFLLMALDVLTIGTCGGVAVIGCAFSIRQILEKR